MEIIKEFGINPLLLLAQIVNFTILLIILRKFLYKPILKVLEERRTKIATSLLQAEKIEKRLEELTKEQEKILGTAKSEAAEIISESKKEAKELSEKTYAQTKETVAAMLKRSEERLVLEKEIMMLEVKKDLSELVIMATSKVSQKLMTEETNKKIVDETIKEVIKQ